MRVVVGGSRVSTGPDALRAAGTATFATDQRVSAIVRPADAGEVQRCVRIANDAEVPVHPISRGKNWGYGSRVPNTDGAVILSLDRMCSIEDYDERRGVVSVQPGVTFRQLIDYLRERGSRLYVGVPGSTADASVVGNTLERGIVQGIHPDRAGQIAALEVVLANGDRTETGAPPASRSAHVHRWGLGPSLDGMFVQSNLAIVTRMTLWLDPIPAWHQHVSFKLTEPGRLGALVDVLQLLRMEGTITTSIGLHNAVKVISLQEQYPFGETGGRTPLPDAVLRRIVDEIGGGAWFGEAGLHAPTEQGLSAHAGRLRSALAGVAEDLSLSAINEPGPFFNPDTGHALHQAYWRKPAPPPPDPDPDRDRCGVIWHAPVMPFEADAVRRCVEIVEHMLPEHGFEPIMSLQAVSPRAVYAVISILYDRDVAGEDERALDCYRSLAAALSGDGFEPYRLGLLARPSPSGRSLVHALKRTLDPKNILAPGRYDFGDRDADPPV
ncbi:MAG: FAD-binding oxidoreductase [Ilumatobacter sp.]|uniref:FAD-binding oxidoreductase n=1 Tax=Ilumatobacter sp. TaxID=1967498 RepID=UPI0026121036|nr:FAD-binding oxidoreductase [Ilumatobacter sp.]MDJ0770344.1 FAD-binding oxidoreductase [Ilumatobacter sp.]